jgi:dihydrofolate synthase/folylpolyglutamate synthase
MESDVLDGALERLDRLVNWERRDRSGGMERSLEPVLDLLERLGAPHRAWPAVLVAGTKGKGSVCALVGAALRRAGLRVGIYASPHVERVTERVRIDGREVSRDDLGRALEAALEAREKSCAEATPGAGATWFDLMTVAAFLLFAQEEVDWAILEVGIGGRLDSTRSVEAVVSVVTNVDLEHTAVLGGTRALIAAEKGAVVAQGGVLVTGVQREEDEEVFGVLEKLVQAAGGRLVSIPQRGELEGRNRALAESVLNELGRCGALAASGEPLWRSFLDAEAMREARLPGRQERFRVGGVPVVLDCGHVASSAELVLAELVRDPELGRRPKLIIALGVDKDATRLLKAFAGQVDRCLCTSAPEGRLLDPRDLAELALGAGHEDPEAWEDPREALQEALGDAREAGGWVLVLGSFYLVGALRPELDRAQHQDASHPTC